MEATYTVGQVAQLAQVTVRTLHHYDDIGLVSPALRTPAGNRVYEHDDLERLQQVLFYRQLGFALDEIAALLDGPGDPLAHLEQQYAVLSERTARLQNVMRTMEKTMNAHRSGVRLTPEEMFEVFGEHDPTEHVEETRERWGDTDAFRESTRRSSSYTKADWLRIRAEADGITARFAALQAAGAPADGPEAIEAAREHRAHIHATYYDLSPEQHRGLGEMYVADHRFRAHYDRVAPGLATYVRDVVVAAADLDGLDLGPDIDG